jgi:hypothetical protein
VLYVNILRDRQIQFVTDRSEIAWLFLRKPRQPWLVRLAVRSARRFFCGLAVPDVHFS